MTLGPLLLGVSLTADLVRGLGGARLRSAARRSGFGVRHRHARVRAARDRHARRCSTTCPTPTCAGAMRWPAACSSPSASPAPSACSRSYFGTVPTYSVIYGAFATRADLPDLDLPRLGDRAARRGDRRLRAGLAGTRLKRWPATDRARASGWRWRCCARWRRARDGRAAGADQPRRSRMRSRPTRCRSIRCSTPWSASTGSAGSTRRAKAATCCSSIRTRRSPSRCIAALLLDPSPDLGPFWKEARFDQLKLAELLRE